MIALSTAYNIRRHNNPDSLADEIKSFGFPAIELNVEIPASFINKLSGRLKIISVHNYCPKVETVPEGRTIYSPYLMSSEDVEERALALKLTLKSIDVAAGVGATALVIHSGEVVTEFTGRHLARHFNETKGKDGYKEILSNFLKERNKKSAVFLENVVAVLDRVLNYAVKKKIKIGIENRFWANEIPSYKETGIILQKLDSPNLGFWYDVGHAVIAEKQGVVNNRLDFLKAYGKRIVGLHLHDVTDVYDHKAPGTGEVNFSDISVFIRQDTLLVNETHSLSSNDEELKNSTAYLKKCGIV
ncbi:MAG: Xylose isomerase-like TIM barrel [Elusimicrobia bacterium ADurb.Bin231]|nr:MAG: Xylose isomerase-like TIM barrel [Elusimicrobia bacterium ADurb.Bin231]